MTYRNVHNKERNKNIQIYIFAMFKFNICTQKKLYTIFWYKINKLMTNVGNKNY